MPLWQRLSADSTLIFETETDQDASRFRPHWREWNIVTAERGMAALADAVGHIRPLYNDSRRCHGFCAEEQTVLQFESRGFHPTPPPWNMTPYPLHEGTRRERRAAHGSAQRGSPVLLRRLDRVPRARASGRHLAGRYPLRRWRREIRSYMMVEGFYGTRLRLIY